MEPPPGPPLSQEGASHGEVRQLRCRAVLVRRPGGLTSPRARSAAALRAQATHELSHPAGRPWLLGRWPEGTVTVAQAGTTRLALIGQHAVTPGQLADAAGRVREVADLDRLAASLAGSFHLVASVAGRVRVQGTVTGVRRVFSARIGGAAVAADRADVLAGLLDAGLDEQRLALHLLEPHILYPLAGQPIWRDVDVAADRPLPGARRGRAAPAGPVLDAARAGGADGRGGAGVAGGAVGGGRAPHPGARPGQLRPGRAGLDLGVQPRRPRARPRWWPTPPPAPIPWPTTSPGPSGQWPGWATSSTTSSRPRRCPSPTPVCWTWTTSSTSRSAPPWSASGC